jgi:hypothetical protein
MAFVLAKKRVVRDWPVTIPMSVDGGNAGEQLCSADFEIVDQDEYEKLAHKGDVALLCRIVVGLGPDVQFEDGSHIECTPDNKSMLFKSGPNVRSGFFDAYHEAACGLPSKNLKGSPATSPAARKRPKRR